MIDSEVAFTVRARRRIGPNSQLSAAVGPAARITLLDGTVLNEFVLRVSRLTFDLGLVLGVGMVNSRVISTP
jgi:hypothetical protein